jgi:uncharacterized membrane protein
MTLDAREQQAIDAFRKLPRHRRELHARRRILASIIAGLIVLLALPGEWRMVTRLLIGWDIAIAVFLGLAFIMIGRADISFIRRNAVVQDEGRFVVLIVTATAAFASLGAILSELGPDNRAMPQLGLAVITLVLSWSVVHIIFALHYAHEYYRHHAAHGLLFPSTAKDDTSDQPDYWDFVYFSFVIGMTAQVSDVGITSKIIRRTATAHGVISFVFNTALLALMVNIAASAI